MQVRNEKSRAKRREAKRQLLLADMNNLSDGLRSNKKGIENSLADIADVLIFLLEGK